MADQVVSTFSSKIRGIAEQRNLCALDLTPLSETHVVFNELVAESCRKLLEVRSSNGDGQAKLLRSFVEVVFELPANEGNHALTRLLSAEGKDLSDRNSILRLQQATLIGTKAAPGLLEQIIEKRPDLFCTVLDAALPPEAEYATKISQLRAEKEITDQQVGKLQKVIEQFKSEPKAETAIQVLRSFKGIISEIIRWNEIVAFVTAHAAEVPAAAVQRRLALELCPQALQCLDERNSKKWAPFAELGAAVTGTDLRAFCRVSDLSGAWQRQVFQAAIESLKSHFNLQKHVGDETKKWESARTQLLGTELMQRYLDVRDNLLSAIGPDRVLRELTPPQMLQLLKDCGARIVSWRSSDAKLEIPETLRGEAERWRGIADSGKAKRRAGSFRRDLEKMLPEIGELFDLHARYERSFASKPTPPSLRIPDPIEHPKHVIWSAAQWKKLELPGEGENSLRGSWIRVNLPCLKVSSGGVIEQDRWFGITADKRLRSLRRSGKGFLLTDPVTDQERPVDLGAIRMVPVTRRKLLKTTSEPFKNMRYSLKLTVKRGADPVNTAWLSDYLKKTKDPLTKEPKLPEKLIAVAFLPDLKGSAKLRAAIIHPIDRAHVQVRETKGGDWKLRRKVDFIKDLPALSLDIPLPAKVEKTRVIAAKLLSKRRALQEKLDQAPQLQVGESRTERRTLVKELQRTHRLERKAWNHVTNLGDDRANKIAGGVVRLVEDLRRKYPGYEIALLTEYRASRKPDAGKWSRDFNKLIMNAAGSTVSEKVAELAARQQVAIPVVSITTFGMNKLVAGAPSPHVVHFGFERKHHGERKIEYRPFSERVAIIREGEGDPKISFSDSSDLLLTNMIRFFVEPSTRTKLPDSKAIDTLLREKFSQIEPQLAKLCVPVQKQPV